MANEITVGLSLAFESGNLSLSRNIGSLLADLAGSAIVTHAVQKVGTSKENLTLHGDHTTAGWCLMRNLDAANWIGIGLDADTPFMKLLFGEACLFRLATSTISVKADTAESLLEYWVIEA